MYKQDEEDDDDLNLFLGLYDNGVGKERASKWRNERLDWEEHVRREIHTKMFDNKYHMRLDSFNKLVSILRPLIEVDTKQSMCSTSGNSPVSPELIVGMGLRFLGGELIKSLEDIFGVDHRHVRSCIIKFLDAVLTKLEMSLPASPAELQTVAAGFKSKSSSEGLFDGVVGSLDGWLCCTCQPIESEVKNKVDYYSGHYQKFGVNVQAICDARLRFLYFAVAAPGRTNDARAFLKCNKLQLWLQSLQNTDYFIIGNNAYVLCDELLIPYSGTSISEVNRTYNFFLSQLRIQIEMAFGLLTTKWRIFRRDLEYGLPMVSKICRAAALLHNFVIDETVMDEDDIEVYEGAPRNLGYLPLHPEDIGEKVVPEDGYEIPVGFSARRTAMIESIATIGLCRPARNIERNG